MRNARRQEPVGNERLHPRKRHVGFWLRRDSDRCQSLETWQRNADSARKVVGAVW